MSPQEFARAIASRWPSNQAELVQDLIRLAGRYEPQALVGLVDQVVEEHEGKFIPRFAEVKRIAEKAGIKQAGGKADGRSGYDDNCQGFPVFQCRNCGNMWSVNTSGTHCGRCGKTRTGNEVCVVGSTPWQFTSQERMDIPGTMGAKTAQNRENIGRVVESITKAKQTQF